MSVLPGRHLAPALLVCSALIVSVLLCGSSAAQQILPQSIGARIGGAPAGGRMFHQAEGVLQWPLPWMWDLNARWRLLSGLELTGGWLGESGADAAIGTLGPTLLLQREHFPLSFEGGVNATLLSRFNFPSKDFGMLFQFTSHIGINVDILEHIRVGYRFQHMSNAGLDRHNPGLNLHLLGVSYLF